MKPRKSRIAHRLLLCLACLLLPIILINTAVNIYNVTNLQRELRHSSDVLFTTLAEEVEGTLSNIQANAYTLGNEVELKALNIPGEMGSGQIVDYWAQIQKLDYVARNSSLDAEINVYLLDAQRVISSDGTMNVLHGGEVGSEEDYGYTGRWEVSYDRQNNKFLSYRYFVSGLGEGFVVSMDLPESALRSILESIRMEDGGGSLLLLEDGSVFTSVGKVEENTLSCFRELLPNGEAASFQADGDILMMRPVCNGINICTSFSEEEILENSWVVAGVSAAVILLSALLGGLMVWLSYLILVKPIRTLVDAMKTVENNNLNIEIPLDTQDEIGFMYAQFNAMVSKLQKLINQVYLQKIRNQEIRLSMYQSQINPHFLHNCLNFISQSAMANGDEYTARMAQFLSKYFRYNIASEDLTTTVREELEMVTAYMEIQKIRFPGRVNYRISLDPEAAGEVLPKLSVQPLVENAFVHAMDRMRTPLFLAIEVRYGEGVLRVSVCDNSGLVEEQAVRELQSHLESGSDGAASLGVKNIHARVKSMYGPGSGLNLGVTKEKGFQAILEMRPPLRSENREEDTQGGAV